MNAREREVMVERAAQMIAHRACCGSEHDPSQGKFHGFCVVCGVPWPCEYAGKPALIADTRAATGEGVDCVLRRDVEKLAASVKQEGGSWSDFLFQLTWTPSYPQPAQGGQGQQELVSALTLATEALREERDAFRTLYKYFLPEDRRSDFARHMVLNELEHHDTHAVAALNSAAAAIESAQSQTPPKEQRCKPCDGTGNKFGGFACDFCNGTGKQLSPEETQRVAEIISSGDIIPQEQGQRREITDADIENACYEAQDAVGCTPWGNFSWSDESRKEVRAYVRRVLEWYESTRAPQPHETKPVAWWNGFHYSFRNADDGTYPSFSENEDTNHDIPLYSGVNPASTEQPRGASAGSDAVTPFDFPNAPEWYKRLLGTHMEMLRVRVVGSGFTVGDEMACRWINTLNTALALSKDALATPSQPSCVQDARDGCEPYFVEVDQNGCASCGHDRMWTVVGPDGVAASKSWGDEEEAEWFCECMNEAFAVGQANPPAAITAKPGKGETK